MRKAEQPADAPRFRRSCDEFCVAMRHEAAHAAVMFALGHQERVHYIEWGPRRGVTLVQGGRMPISAWRTLFVAGVTAEGVRTFEDFCSLKTAADDATMFCKITGSAQRRRAFRRAQNEADEILVMPGYRAMVSYLYGQTENAVLCVIHNRSCYRLDGKRLFEVWSEER